jgi:transposase
MFAQFKAYVWGKSWCFDNRRQVGSYVGMTGTPYNSGGREREQGISTSGNARARKVAIVAWLWLLHQSGGALSPGSVSA